MTDDEKEKLTKELEAMSLAEIRKKLDNHGYGLPHGKNYKFVSSWLLRKETSAREAREAKALSMARAANDFANEANRIASAASARKRRSVWIDRTIAIIAIIIAAIAAREHIMLFISGLRDMIFGNP